MKPTKLFLLSIIFSISTIVNAQEKVTNIIGISPNLTHTYDENKYPFPILLDANYFGENSSVYLETMMEPNFTSFFIPISYSRQIANDFFINFELGYGLDNYSAELSYYYWGSASSATQEFIKEEVKGDRTILGMNYGKAFYFNSEKKLMLMPFVGFYSNTYSYYRTTSAYGPNTYDFSRENYGYNISFGANIGLSLNYQLTKHFGLGLNLNDVLNFYHVNYRKDNSAEEISRNQWEFNFDKAPRLSLQYYFKTKMPIKNK